MYDNGTILYTALQCTHTVHVNHCIQCIVTGSVLLYKPMVIQHSCQCKIALINIHKNACILYNLDYVIKRNQTVATSFLIAVILTSLV